MNLFNRIEVIAQCNYQINRIRKHRAKKHEIQIAKQMKKRKYFFGSYYNREEAIAALKQDSGDWFNKWSLVEMDGAYQEQSLTNTLFLANRSTEDKIFLSTKEVLNIWDN